MAAPKKHTDSENPEKSSVKEKPPASDEKLSDEGRQAAFSKPKAKAETAKPKDKAETVPAVSDKDKPQERAAKQMKADKAAFVYTDKDGKPTSDSKSADKTKPVVAVVGDKQGRLTAKYHFSDHKAVEERRPSTVERYEYKVSSKDQTVEIKQQLVDLTQPQEVVAATVKTTRKLTDSSVSVQMSLANGIEQKAGFDGQGKLTEFSRKEGGDNYAFVMKDGNVQSVLRNGQALPDKEAELAAQAGMVAAQVLRRDYAEPSAEVAKPSDQAQVTPADINKPGFNGKLTSPDGKHSYTVVAGEIRDGKNASLGTMDANGLIEAGDKTKTYVNSRFENYVFEGLENGKARTFEAGGNAPNGRMFIPDQKGEPVEHDVRMGMIINKKTGEQVGAITAPTENSQGKLSGGAIATPDNPPQVRALSDLKDVVFDLKLTGQSGLEGRRLQGVCLGPPEFMADGKPRPDSPGGIFNIKDALEAQAKKVGASDAKVTEQQDQNVFFRGWDWATGKGEALAGDNKSQRDSAKAIGDDLQSILTTGKASAQLLKRLQEETTEKVLAKLDNPLAAERRKLDLAQNNLEALPSDTTTINGKVNLAVAGANGEVKHTELTIKNGQILGIDGKSPIGQFQGTDGRLVMLDPKTKQLQSVRMQDMQGAVWQLEYKDDQKQAKKVEWISLGNAGIASFADLKQRGAGEVQYAQTVNQKSNNEASQKALAETQQKQQEYEKNLNRIATQGISSFDDLRYVMDGPRKHVRAEINQEKEGRKSIELPNITDKTISDQTNGYLRLGSDSYKIQNGQLHRMQRLNGREQVEQNAAGKLGPGYVVHLEGQQPIDLSKQNRVLMEFTIGSAPEKHQVMGMGPARKTEGYGYQSGGLVNVNELVAQSEEARSQAAAGKRDYFDSRPWIVGGFNNWAMGDRDGILRDFEKQISTNIETLKARNEKMFANGFDSDASNNYLDGSVKVTQVLLDAMRFQANTTDQLALEGKQTQKLGADSMVMAATTVATLGAGVVFSGLVNAGRMGTAAAAGGEVLTGIAAGGTFSLLGRASNSADHWGNLKSGMVEGGTMAFGSVFAKGLGNLAQVEKVAAASRAGQVLNLEQQAVMNTVLGRMVSSGAGNTAINTVRAGGKLVDAVGQAGGFLYAATLRDKDAHPLTASNVMQGALWMLAGQGLGHLAGQSRTLFGVSKDGVARVAEHGVGHRMMRDTVMSYTNAGMMSMTDAWEQERARIAQEMRLDVKLVSNNMMKGQVNYGNIVKTMHQAGTIGALSAPLFTVASHPLEVASRKMLGLDRETPAGKVPQPRIEGGSNQPPPAGLDAPGQVVVASEAGVVRTGEPAVPSGLRRAASESPDQQLVIPNLPQLKAPEAEATPPVTSSPLKNTGVESPLPPSKVAAAGPASSPEHGSEPIVHPSRNKGTQVESAPAPEHAPVPEVAAPQKKVLTEASLEKERVSQSEEQQRINRDGSDKTPETTKSPVTDVPEQTLNMVRIKETAAEIAARVNEPPISREKFKELLNLIPADDRAGRALAQEFLEQSVTGMQRKALDHQLERLQTHLKTLEGDQVKKITVVALSEDSAGKALGYLLKTNTDIEVEVKVLDPRTMKEGLSPANPVLLLDSPGQATKSQSDFLKQLPKFYASDLGGFEQGINVFDLGIAKFTGNTQALQERMAGLVGKAKELQKSNPNLDVQGAVQAVLQGPLNQEMSGYGNGQVIRPEGLPRTAKVRKRDMDGLYDQVISRPLFEAGKNTFVEVTPKDVENYLTRIVRAPMPGEAKGEKLSVTEQAAAAIMLKTGMVRNTYETMVGEMSALHTKLQSELPPGKTMDDVVILTQLESNTSANMVHHLYSKLNGLKPENFVSAADFQSNPQAFKDKVVVYLDDYSFTGRQVQKLLEMPLQESVGATGKPLSEALRQSGAPVIVAHLGGYLPADKLKPVFNFDAKFIYSHDGVRSQFLSNPELQGLGLSPELISSIAGKPGYVTKDPSRIVDVGVLNPHRSHPTNNRGIVAEFINRVLKENTIKEPKHDRRIPRAPEEHGENLYRGGAPKTDQEFRSLVEQTAADIVIDLRGGKGAREEQQSVAQQKQWAESMGDKSPEMINIPIPVEMPMRDSPAYEQMLHNIHQFETTLQKARSEGKRVYFHCFHGQDRTGLLGAVHDVLIRGKSVEQALQTWREKGTPSHPGFYSLHRRQQFEQILSDYQTRYANLKLR